MGTTREIALLRQAAAAFRVQGDDEAAARVEGAIRDLVREDLPPHLREIIATAQTSGASDPERPPPDGDRTGPSSAA